MANTTSFSYRLPLTYLRITGTRQATTDSLTGACNVERTSTVATEIGADSLTRCQVELSPEALATQKATWKLLPDGRLAGADIATTTDSLAMWKTALQAGATALTRAGVDRRGSARLGGARRRGGGRGSRNRNRGEPYEFARRRDAVGLGKTRDP